MSEEQAAPSPAPDADEQRPGGVISTANLLRVLLVLLTIWTAFSGLALVFFQSGADATIGGGLEGGEGEAAQRLLGVHLLVLAPIYALLVWRPKEYGGLMWVPYAAQIGVVVVTTFDILRLDRDFSDGALPLIVASTFLVLMLYVWRADRQAQAAEHGETPTTEDEPQQQEAPPEQDQPPA